MNDAIHYANLLNPAGPICRGEGPSSSNHARVTCEACKKSVTWLESHKQWCLYVGKDCTEKTTAQVAAKATANRRTARAPS